MTYSILKQGGGANDAPFFSKNQLFNTLTTQLLFNQ